MIEEGINKVLTEKKIRAIKRPSQVKMTKKAADLLTEQEVRTMLTACKSSRDRALISVLYESGMRIGELGELQWQHIKFDEYGIVINVDFKTGKPRFIRCVFSQPYLNEWYKDSRVNASDYVFSVMRKKNNKPTYEALYRQIQRIVKRADIEKKVTPHLFRHSRITHLLQQGMSESAIKLMMWGTLDTDMFSRYAHLTGQDVDDAVLELYNIKKKKNSEKEKVLEARVCPRCQTINGPTQRFCGYCAESLTQDAQEEKNMFENDLKTMSTDSKIEMIEEYLSHLKESKKS
jgi:integrase/recombinase XerD